MTDDTSKPANVPQSTRVPVLPLRDVVVYPHMVIPLFVGRDKSILALDEAMRLDKQILLVAQKQADIDEPQPRDLYTVGTVATILQLLKLPDGTVKVLVEGVARALVEGMDIDAWFAADMTPMPDIEQYDEREIEVLSRSVVSHFEQYVKLNKKVPPEILTSLAGIEQPGRLADTVAAHMALKLSEKQKVLEMQDVRARLEQVMTLIEGEMEVLQIEKKIRGRVKTQMEKSQREYYLNEQMKAIQKELGDLDDAPNEIGDLEKRIAKAGMPKEAREKATAELNKLKLMSPMSAEATVVRNYVDWLVKVPWKKRTKIRLDIAAAQQVLEPLLDVEHLQHFLLLFELERQVRGDGIAETAGFIDARERGQDLGRDLLVELHILIELLDHRAPHRLDLVVGGGVRRDRRHRDGVVRLEVHDLVEARALAALDQHLHGAVREFQHLQDVGDAADAVEILGQRIVLRGGFLRDQHDALARFHRRLERLDRLRAPDEQRDHHVREHHHVAQRQQRHLCEALFVRHRGSPVRVEWLQHGAKSAEIQAPRSAMIPNRFHATTAASVPGRGAGKVGNPR